MAKISKVLMDGWERKTRKKDNSYLG